MATTIVSQFLYHRPRKKRIPPTAVTPFYMYMALWGTWRMLVPTFPCTEHYETGLQVS